MVMQLVAELLRLIRQDTTDNLLLTDADIMSKIKVKFANEQRALKRRQGEAAQAELQANIASAGLLNIYCLHAEHTWCNTTHLLFADDQC